MDIACDFPDIRLRVPAILYFFLVYATRTELKRMYINREVDVDSKINSKHVVVEYIFFPRKRKNE